MGRSGQAARKTAVPGTFTAAAESSANAQLRREVATLAERVARETRQISGRSPEQLKKAKAAALGQLSHGRQATLVVAAASYDGPNRQRVREAAAELLLLANYGFIERYIRAYTERGLERDVLRQEAELGLLDAIPRFNAEVGASFLSFAAHRMRHRVSTALRMDARLIRLQKKADAAAGRAIHAIRDLEAAGIRPTPERVAGKTGDSLELVQDVWVHVVSRVASLDTPVGSADDGDTLTLGGTIAAEGDETEQVALRQLRAQLRELIETKLPPAERHVISRMYAIGAGDDAPLARLTALAGTDRQSDVRGLEPLLLDEETLHEGFATGLYALQPAAQETEELADLLGIEPTPQQLERLTQSGLRRLRPYLAELAGDLAYRGPDAVENSAYAQDAVRAELRRRAADNGGRLSDPVLGELTAGQIGRLKPGRAGRTGTVKAQLRIAAENAGLVDAASGRLLFIPAPEVQPARAAATEQVQQRKRTQRVGMPELIRAGVLEPGARVFATYKGTRIGGTLLANGGIRLDDGREATSPSTASTMVSKESNGYAFWRLESTGERLGDVRDRFERGA